MQLVLTQAKSPNIRVPTVLTLDGAVQALEPYAELVVGNARHLSKVPRRKTNVVDSEWIAELLRHGLIRKSFIPPLPICAT